MIAVIDRIRDISLRCLRTEPLDSGDARWLGEAFARFLAHDVASLEDAIGLQRLRGGVPWWKEEAIRLRNAALNRLAANCLSHLPLAERIARIEALSLRYASSGWPIDRRSPFTPQAGHGGSPRQYLHEAFASGAAMPLSRRQLRNIIVPVARMD